jgi:hypothetical protein
MEELTMITYPEKIVNEEQLEELLSRPGAEAIEMFSRIDGDLIFLGVSGKIGQSLARMANGPAIRQEVRKELSGYLFLKIRNSRKKLRNTESKLFMVTYWIRNLPAVYHPSEMYFFWRE